MDLINSSAEGGVVESGYDATSQKESDYLNLWWFFYWEQAID